MKSKIALAFENCKKEKRAALITYTVAGDNTKNNSLKILNAIAKNADILELGFPHNTPIADGGQIQGSSHRALKNGIKLKDVFQIVRKFKKSNLNKPIILTIKGEVNPPPKGDVAPLKKNDGAPLEKK